MEIVFSVLIDGYLESGKEKKEDYVWRLKKITKILDDFLIQSQTGMTNDNHKKRKKVIIVPIEMYWKIFLFAPYNDIFNIFMFISKNFKKQIFDNDVFWKEKFGVEFKGYVYPPELGKPKDIGDPEEKWKAATIKLLKKIKNIKNIKGPNNWISVNRKTIYNSGNELLLKFAMKHIQYPFGNVNTIKKYVNHNKTLNTQLLIDLIPDYYYMYERILPFYVGKDFDKLKLINAFVDYGFKTHIEDLSYNIKSFRIKEKITKTYQDYKEEYQKILLKLLKIGIVLNITEYNLYDEDFMDKAKEIDEEIEYILKTDDFLKDVRFLGLIGGVKYNIFESVVYDKKLKNSYIFVVNLLRSNWSLFNQIPSKFKSKMTDKNIIYKKWKKVNFSIMKIDKLEYLRLFEIKKIIK